MVSEYEEKLKEFIDARVLKNEERFEKLVKEYSGWIVSLNEPENIKKYEKKAFIRGMCSVFGAYTRFPSAFDFDPISSRKNLNNMQKNYIYLASSWQKIEQKLDDIISGNSNQYTIEEAKEGKPFVKEMYNQYKILFCLYNQK
jgi:hypothetical protein